MAAITMMVLGDIAAGAQWTSPAVDATAPTAQATGPAVVTDSTGIATAVWRESLDGNTFSARAARFTDGAWSAPMALSTTDAQAVAIGMAPSGTVTAAWSQLDANGYNAIFARRYVGDGWSAPTQISTPGTDTDINPKVAVDGAGVTTVTWMRFRAGSMSMNAARASAQGTWEAEVPLATGLVGSPSLSIGSGADGTTIAVWQEDSGSGPGSLKSRRCVGAATCTWSSATTLSTSLDQGAPAQPAVVVDLGGVGTATWDEFGMGGRAILSARTSGVGWTPATSLGLGSTASMAVDGQGRVMALWSGFDSSTGDTWVEARRFASGTWEPGALIAPSPVTNPSDWPAQVAMNASGTAVALWSDREGGTQTARSATFDGTTWGATTSLSQDVAGSMAVAVDPTGVATALWWSYLPSNLMTIQSSRYAFAPSAPRDVVATAGDRQATVSWLAPASDGGTPVTTYTVTASPGGASCTAAAPATSCTVTGLTKGTAYAFTVTASNAIGMSSASAASAPVAPQGSTPAATPNAATVPPSLRVRLLPSRRSLRAGQAMTLGVRTSNGASVSTAMARMRGQMAVATAEGVRTCVGLPANLVITRRPSGSVRSGRTVCWSSGDIPAGQQRTAVLGVRAVAVRAVSRTISASARSTAGSQASARATAKAGVRITPRAPRPVVTG